jgi:hypothetical protein
MYTIYLRGGKMDLKYKNMHLRKDKIDLKFQNI